MPMKASEVMGLASLPGRWVSEERDERICPRIRRKGWKHFGQRHGDKVT